jgi:uncharacterized protein YxjI
MWPSRIARPNEPTLMNHYLYLNNASVGPFTLDQLNQKLLSGEITKQSPCCREGDQTWKTVGDFLQGTSASGAAAATSSNPSFTHSQYLIRRKIFKFLGAAFHIYDSSGALAFYSKQKAFKLKEDIRIYTGEDMQKEVLVIQARNILDVAATYDVHDPATNTKVGAIKRKGLKSILQDEWMIMDQNDQEIGFVKEDSLVLALIRRFVIDLIPQTYHGEVRGTKVCTFKQNFNPFVIKINLDYSLDTQGLLDRRLGIAAAVLLCAIEGKQD